jgi:TPR repeat protein
VKREHGNQLLWSATVFRNSLSSRVFALVHNLIGRYSQNASLGDWKPSPAVLEAMDQDDPDVQIREVFRLEMAAINDELAYKRALEIYRKVRDHRVTDARSVLGRYALYGTNGVPKDRAVAEYWLHEAVRSGSKPAQDLLSAIGKTEGVK